MQLIIMIGYSKREQDALNAIFSREQLMNCIFYPDHAQMAYRIEPAQLPTVRARLRAAEITRAWLTK